MILYIDGKPAKNIQLNKAKRHALAHYRHTQLINNIKDITTRLAITLAVTITLAAVYLLTTN
jgi:hypothetical protein